MVMALEGKEGSMGEGTETSTEAASAQKTQVAAVERYEPASAKDIPSAGTSLAARPKGKVGSAKVVLLADAGSVTPLAEVAKINGTDRGGARTPLMTVIQAVLAEHGGAMAVAELASEDRKYWNRPLPSSPYSPEEFIYVLTTSSDDLRVSA
jgi:hypothetical protein